MKSGIDLVVLDMDGTIYGRQFAGGISARVRHAIAAVQEAGTPVTIATGRIFDFVRAVAPELGITLPVITAQGAVIGDPVSGAVLYESLIREDDARKVAAWADGEERTTVFYLNSSGGRTRLVQSAPGGGNGSSGWEGWDSSTYDHWFGSPREMHVKLFDLLSVPGVRPLKFITVNDPALEPDQTAALQRRFGDGVHMSRSHQYLVEGTAPTANKGHGLLRLTERLGVDPERVLAIGDNENDIPMLREAGLAVCMGQATAVVRAEADWIAPTLDEDGAAVALERFVLS
ncbi:MAG: HAD family phosphatase [Caldilineaceae bacterium SB0665_bin_25]|nr:Cof-type HAD-IIB family hydrolase [Caldilineaceae bacterium]MXZ22446.1 HAD family phosphatase [Caldilineaceae bacterium SB0665_bin_25]